MQVPEKYQKFYLDVLLKNHEAMNQDKYDHGQTDTLLHEISLKTPEPICTMQLNIQLAYCQDVE